MRYAISGAGSVQLDVTVSATGPGAGDPTGLTYGRNLLGRNISTGRVLFVKGIWFYNAGAAITLDLHDASDGATSIGATTTRRLSVQAASGQLTLVDLPAPGLKFVTGCVASRETTTATTALNGGQYGGNGYEEG